MAADCNDGRRLPGSDVPDLSDGLDATQRRVLQIVAAQGPSLLFAIVEPTQQSTTGRL